MKIMSFTNSYAEHKWRWLKSVFYPYSESQWGSEQHWNALTIIILQNMFFCVLKPEYKLAEAKIYSYKQTTLQSYNFSSPLLITDNSFNNYL